MFYTVKVEVKTDSDKGVKSVNELYLVQAESVTDAEAKMYIEFKDYGNDWTVRDVNQSKIVKVVK